MFLVVTTGACCWPLWEEDRDASKHLIVHKTAFHNNEWIIQLKKVNVPSLGNPVLDTVIPRWFLLCREPCGPLETGGGTSVYDDVGFPDGSEEISPSLFLLLITKGLREEMGWGPSPSFLQKCHGRSFYDFSQDPRARKFQNGIDTSCSWIFVTLPTSVSVIPGCAPSNLQQRPKARWNPQGLDQAWCCVGAWDLL